MEYISTRGDMKPYQATDAIIKGLADDGGLFVPKTIPEPYKDISSLQELEELNYKQLSYEIIKHFLTDFTESELKLCIDNAYDEKFDDEMIAPLVKSGGFYFLELFHGKTLAFKDMALSILPHFMTMALKKKNIGKRILILAATSGDTGKAAMEGFRDVEGVSVIVLYPKNGVSRVQELQMTTQLGKNVEAVGILGNFDDCQSTVKSIFSDRQLAKELDDSDVLLSSANSINIGRLVPQIVYYFYGYFQLVSGGVINMGDKVNFCVPTGNFGNILACYYAKKMGLPVKNLICASNENKVLYDFFSSGEYNANRELCVTNSPSMDIIVSSNLERLLYHLSLFNTDEIMKALKEKSVFGFNRELLHDEGFRGGFATQDETLQAISDLFDQTGYIMDTHTAVAYLAYKAYKNIEDNRIITIITSTASPYKFPKSVMTAIDNAYTNLDEFELIKELAYLLAEVVPIQIRDLDQKEILHTHVCEKEDIRAYVTNIIKKG